MQIYAIADLHLSLTSEKPMDVFGEAWRGHAEKLERNWRERVQADDLVLVPGDISWAMQLSAALPDLSFIGNLPGKKILLKGNHDYWWSAIGRVRSVLPAGMRAIQNDSIAEDGIGICGTRDLFRMFRDLDREVVDVHDDGRVDHTPDAGKGVES